MFFTRYRQEIIILPTINLLTGNAFKLVQSKILTFGKDLMKPL